MESFQSCLLYTSIKEHDNGITNFHFEVAADVLKDDEIELISDMRPGLIQLEIGVQSTNIDTITEIHRKMDFKKVADLSLIHISLLFLLYLEY